MKIVYFAVLALFSASAHCQDKPIEATTSIGEKVRLLPNGRWEYAEEKKAQVQRKAAAAESERERRAQGLFGGRIYEGDKDYNRGTLNPARR